MQVYIANLSYETGESELRDSFAAYGTITAVSLPTDRVTGRPRGFGFLTFESADAAQAAVSGMNGRELGGRPLKVSLARSKTGDAGSEAPGASSSDGPRRNFGPDRKAGAFAARYRNRR